MIDGFKSWHTKTNLDIDSFNYNGLQLTKNNFEGYVINGSLHKFSNDGQHNANDYYLSSLQNTLNQLYVDIGLNADITPVNGFEFGVNIQLPFNPGNALKCLILHKSNKGSYSKNYKEFKYKNHTFKFYNKSGLTNIEPYHSENILRIEVSVNKMIYIRQKKVHCIVLSDLLDVAVWQRLEQILIETIQECLFIEFTPGEIRSLSLNDRIKYLEYCNSQYWENLHENRNKYSRERAKCDKFIKLHSKSTLKTDIINLIKEKCNELRDVSKTKSMLKYWCKITILPPEIKLEKCDEITIKINSKIVPFKPGEITDLKRCKGCGKIILKPRIGQMYCSAKIVGYTQAHKCRNNNSNPRNNSLKFIRQVLTKT